MSEFDPFLIDDTNAGLDHPDRVPGNLRDAQTGMSSKRADLYERGVEPGVAGKTVQKWADSAMFTAEKIDPEQGPQVRLLWMTPDPLGAIAATCKMYKGEVVRDLADVTDAERKEFFAQVQKTHLQAPFEFVQFHFLIEGVTRAFTHQMVRQRTATYAQRSDRFAVQEGGIPVGLPPSLHGTKASHPGEFSHQQNSDSQKMRVKWDRARRYIERFYGDLINDGMPQEDARGLLPTNLLTVLHYRTDLRSLIEHGGNRLCTQAQFEWRLVFAKIVEAIRNFEERRWYSRPGPDMGGIPSRESFGLDWQLDAIADLFRPACYLTGKCEFKASFDRKCSIRDRVDDFAAHNVPSEHWADDNVRVQYGLLPIQPAEWLLDSGAAR